MQMLTITYAEKGFKSVIPICKKTHTHIHGIQTPLDPSNLTSTHTYKHWETYTATLTHLLYYHLRLALKHTHTSMK